MRRDLFSIGTKKDRSEEFHSQVFSDPTYEDPKDVILIEKPTKPPRKRLLQQSSPRPVNDGRTLLRDQKRKLTKKYEGLIMTLMDRCEENVVVISEKDAQISKLKEKLKAVLDYNRLFADENDHLREQNQSLFARVQQCDAKVEELETRVKHEAPDRDTDQSTAVPLVEICISCGSRQVLLAQAREQNLRLRADLQALKDVLYRLNIQLARYQEKIRSTLHSNQVQDTLTPGDTLESIIAASLATRHDGVHNEDQMSRSGRDTPSEKTTRVVDLSGLLSAQALAPLFDAYQDNIQEKENLIHDYEKQFENINRKTKNLVSENKSLQERVNILESDILELSKREKKLSIERETSEIERATLTERAEKAEAKLKEVYELYEDKIASMMRDYETIHREYFATKNALAASEGRFARMDATLRGRTVPADLHERRLDCCKRLLDELKHQYTMESERKTDQLSKLQEQKNLLEAQRKSLEEKVNQIQKENEELKVHVRNAEKNAKLYRKAAEVFRRRLKHCEATRRALRRRRPRPLGMTSGIPDLARIRDEIKLVKARAYKSLEELEKRMLSQERRAVTAEQEYRHELERARLALEHKEGVIRSLIDKVADVEEVRLSQSNTHRLQGIDLESSSSEEEKEDNRREERKPKLVPTGGGYYQDSRKQKKKEDV